MTDYEECRQAFSDWCPYKGNPDPWAVWQAAWTAANLNQETPPTQRNLPDVQN